MINLLIIIGVAFLAFMLGYYMGWHESADHFIDLIAEIRREHEANKRTDKSV